MPKKGSKKPNRKTVRKTVRFALRDWNRIVWLAKTYANGNVAKWIRHGALEAERQFLK